MKFHKNKFLTTVSAIALVLAVGACSSSSDDNEGMSMLQTDLDAAIAKAAALQEDLDEANADLETAEDDLMTANDEGMSMLQTDLDAAIAKAAALQEDLDEANADLETAEDDLMTANDMVTSVRGMLDQANLDLAQARTDLQMAMDNSDDEMEIAQLKQAVTDAEGERENYKTMLVAATDELAEKQAEVDETKVKEALAERIAREAKILAAIVLSQVSATPTLVPTFVTSVTATRNAAGMVAVKVDDDGFTGGETTAGSGDWNGVTMTSGTNTLVVYTDIEAPSDKDFKDKYGADVLNNALAGDNVGYVASAGFPSAPGTSWIYGGDADRATTVIGTFDGVPGQFTCTMPPCTVMAGAMGKLAESGDWEFRADSQNTATVKEPDAAYAYFGWWLNKPEDNAMVHNVEVFAGSVADGTADTPATIGNAIVGNARYAGLAAGKYATKTFTAGVQKDAAAGHFTANATLTAKFGDDSGDPGTIDGMVTGFELDDGSSPAWKVILEEADISAAAFNGTTEVDFGGGATASGDPANPDGVGAWQGSFYNADATDDTNAPGTVAGTFDAVVPNAAVIGAFGATKQ